MSRLPTMPLADAERVLGASAVIARLQKALDNYAERTARGYLNIVVDAETVQNAIVLLAETCATDGAAEQIPDEVIEQFCAQMQEPLAVAGKKFCDELYGDILYSVQEYLRDNAVFNIRGKFDAQQREVVTAHMALRAVEDSTTLREAQANAYAARKGYWSEERAAEYRAEALAEQVPAQ